MDFKTVICNIGWLIRTGTEENNWLILESLLNDSKNILITILNKMIEKNTPPGEGNDYPMNALNSHYGNNIEALIYITLKIVNEKRKENEKIKDQVQKWNDADKIEETFNNLLNANIPEAYYFLGQYIPNFNYLDSKWLMNQVEKMKSLKFNSNSWEDCDV